MYLKDRYMSVPLIPLTSQAFGHHMSEIQLGFYHIHAAPYYLNDKFDKLWKAVSMEKK